MVGDLQTVEQYRQRSSPILVKVLSPMSDLPAQAPDRRTGNLQGIWGNIKVSGI